MRERGYCVRHFGQCECIQQKIALRPYQRDAVSRINHELRAGHRRLVLVVPTGGGKTVIAADLIVRALNAGRRVLFVAHRRELIQQARDKLVAMGVDAERISVMMGGERRENTGSPVTLASIEMIRRHTLPAADVVFVDEAHRALADSYRALFARYSTGVHLGLTATPFRSDGRGLGAAYQTIVRVGTPRELIDAGYLVSPRIFAAPDMPDLSGVRVRRGDFDPQALEPVVNRPRIVGGIVETWRRLAGGARTVVFAVSVKHSRAITEQFVRSGVAAEHLDASCPFAERAAILRRIEQGTTRVVVNCNVLCEGWDQPSVKCCVLARPTHSTGLFLQQAGRVLRPWNDQRAIILDHAGNALRHGFPQDDRTFSLHDLAPPATRRPPPVRACATCTAVVAIGCNACPECGTALRPPDRLPEEFDAELVEIPEGSVPGTMRQRATRPHRTADYQAAVEWVM